MDAGLPRQFWWGLFCGFRSGWITIGRVWRCFLCLRHSAENGGATPGMNMAVSSYNGSSQGTITTLTSITIRLKGTPIRTKSPKW